MRITADVISGTAIAVWFQSISGVNAVGPLAAFYDINGTKGEVIYLLFCHLG
jgi:hypothetical protein